MNSNLVTIIIPTFNREDFIIETLESVLSQTYTNWECIIVDDNSTDKTLDIINEYIANDIRFVLIKKDKKAKKGASVSRNIGLFHAKGDYIQFLDSDDLLAANKLESQLNLLQKQVNDFALVTCKWDIFNEKADFSGICRNRFDFRDFSSLKEYFDLIGQYGGFYPLMSFLVSKKLISKAGYWNEDLTLNDDGEFFFRIFIYSEKLVFDSNTYVLYRTSTGDNLSILNSVEKARSLVNSWSIIEALYKTKYAEDQKMLYIGKKKRSVYHEIKKAYPKLIIENKVFFIKQLKEDDLKSKGKNLIKRIKNRLKSI